MLILNKNIETLIENIFKILKQCHMQNLISFKCFDKIDFIILVTYKNLKIDLWYQIQFSRMLHFILKQE